MSGRQISMPARPAPRGAHKDFPPAPSLQQWRGSCLTHAVIFSGWLTLVPLMVSTIIAPTLFLLLLLPVPLRSRGCCDDGISVLGGGQARVLQGIAPPMMMVSALRGGKSLKGARVLESRVGGGAREGLVASEVPAPAAVAEKRQAQASHIVKAGKCSAKSRAAASTVVRKRSAKLRGGQLRKGGSENIPSHSLRRSNVEQGKPRRATRCIPPPGAICHKRPTFGSPSENVALRCALHRRPGDADLVNPLCTAEGCGLRASYGGQETAWAASACRLHRSSEHSLIHQKGVVGGGKPRPPRLGSPAPAKPTCQHEACQALATWSNAGHRLPSFCRKHHLANQTSIHTLRCDGAVGCPLAASYGTPGGGRSRRCSRHSRPADIDLKHRTCRYAECTTAASYEEWAGVGALFCALHRGPGHVTSTQRADALALWLRTLPRETQDKVLRQCFQGTLDWSGLPPEARHVRNATHPTPLPRGLPFLKKSLVGVPQSDMIAFLKRPLGSLLVSRGWVPPFDLEMDLPGLNFAFSPPRLWVRPLGQCVLRRVS